MRRLDSADGGLLSSGSTFVASGYTCAVADGIYCDTTANACAAVRKPGERCSSVDPAACPTGFCVDDICTARSGLGESCAITQVCVDSAYCDGVCAKRKPPGAACHGFRTSARSASARTPSCAALDRVGAGVLVRGVIGLGSRTGIPL